MIRKNNEYSACTVFKREDKANKYIVLSDDKGAITLLSKTMQNVEKYIGMKCIAGVTTAKLCWLIANTLHFFNKEQIENILCYIKKQGALKAHLAYYKKNKRTTS